MRTNVYPVTFDAANTTQTTTSTTFTDPIQGKHLLGISVAQGSRALFVRVSFLHGKQTGIFRGLRLVTGWVRIGDAGSDGSDALVWSGDIETQPDDALQFYVENSAEALQTVRAQVLVGD